MSLEREDCGRCGGTGEVTKDVAGRSGLVPCPDCDNVPRYAVPDDPPEDPVARLEEIDQELKELERQKQAWKDLRSDVREAKELLEGVADHDLIPDESSVKLEHISQQVGMVMHPLDGERGISYQKERLGEERAKLRTYLDHLEDEADA